MFLTLGRTGTAVAIAALLAGCSNKPATSTTGDIVIVRGGSPIANGSPVALAHASIMAAVAPGASQPQVASTDGLEETPVDDPRDEAIQASVREADPYRLQYADLGSDDAG